MSSLTSFPRIPTTFPNVKSLGAHKTDGAGSTWVELLLGRRCFLGLLRPQVLRLRGQICPGKVLDWEFRSFWKESTVLRCLKRIILDMAELYRVQVQTAFPQWIKHVCVFDVGLNLWQARHKTFAPRELGSLLTILSEVRLVHVDLFTSAAQAIAPRVRELRPAEIMRCTRALSRCGVKNETFCQSVGDDIVGRWSKSQPTNHSGFRCEDLVEACWCFAVLEFYHHDLLQLMFQVLRESQKVTADALCQLYELHLSLECLSCGAVMGCGHFFWERSMELWWIPEKTCSISRSEHKERYAPLRIEEKSINALLEHYKVQRSALKHRKQFVYCTFSKRARRVLSCHLLFLRKIVGIAGDVLRRCEAISQQPWRTF